MSLMRKSSAAIAVVILAAGVFAGGSRARAADDVGPTTAVGKIFGWVGRETDEKIDFRERPKLVVPPNPQALPEPRPAAANAKPGAWPTETDDALRTGARVARSAKPAPGEPERANLTDPPIGYRQPTKDMSKWKDPDDQKKGFNPFASLGSLGKNIGLGGDPEPSK